jgi:hypothetical protein
LGTALARPHAAMIDMRRFFYMNAWPPSRIAQRKSELRLYVKFFDTYYVTIFRVEELTARRSWPSFVRNTQPAPNCNGTPRAEPVRVIPLAAPRLEVGAAV